MTAPDAASGSCLCGSVRFRVRLPSKVCAHCHCSICRKNHGAGLVTWFTVEPSRIEVTEGSERIVRFRSSEHGERSFCGHCGTSLFFCSTLRPDDVDVVLACMDEPIDRGPDLHVHFDDRVPWVEVGDDLPRLGGGSGLEPLARSSDRKPHER